METHMYLNLFRISLYVLQVKIIFRLKFFNFPCPWLILNFLRLLALIIYQPYKHVQKTIVTLFLDTPDL